MVKWVLRWVSYLIGLIVHNVDKPAGPILQKSRAFSIIKVGDLWHKTGDAPAVVLGDMALEPCLERQKPVCKSGRVSVKHCCGLEVHRSRVRVIFRINMRCQGVNTATVLGDIGVKLMCQHS
jgi:hypothetical protein